MKLCAAFWMGADPLAAMDALGNALHHVHAKDTFLNTAALNLTGRRDTRAHQHVKDRAGKQRKTQISNASTRVNLIHIK